MTKYETELKESSKNFLKLPNFEEYLGSKFEEGLSLKIKEKMSIIGT